MALGVGKELGKVVQTTGPSYSTVSTRAALQIENHAADCQQLFAACIVKFSYFIDLQKSTFSHN